MQRILTDFFGLASKIRDGPTLAELEPLQICSTT